MDALVLGSVVLTCWVLKGKGKSEEVMIYLRNQTKLELLWWHSLPIEAFQGGLGEAGRVHFPLVPQDPMPDGKALSGMLACFMNG